MVFYDKFIFFDIKIKDFLYYLFIIFFSIAFGGQYTFGLLVSFLITVFFEYFFNKNQKPDFFKKVLSLLIPIMFVYFVFYFSILNNNVAIGSVGILNFLRDPLSSLRFVLLSFSGVLIGVDLFNRLNISINLGSIIGLTVVFIYLYSLILYFKSEMFKKTIVPLVMIIYSIITIGIIFVSRFDYDIKYGLTSRYTTSTMIGLVGCFIILLYNLFRRRALKKIKIFSLNNFPIVLIFLFVISCQTVTITNEWTISPYRKVFYKKLEVMALDLDNCSKNDLSLFQTNNVDYVYNTFAVLKKYKLNVFRKKGGYLDKQNGVIKLSGWNSDGWIGKDTKVMVFAPKEGVLSLNLNIPEEIFNKVYKNSIVLQVINGENILGQKEFSEGSFDKGSIEVTFNVPKETELILNLKLDKSFIPKEYNLGEDSRNLGIIVNDIKVK